ncbi:hypothetical protein SK128_004178 [Halocaridina rubra]|uniref:Fibronectin type-II domain-containing protein n=1 Tax=Halocaridina rubra TaxID=373956 RepID=A0AAN8XJZ6_HALRR
MRSLILMRFLQRLRFRIFYTGFSKRYTEDGKSCQFPFRYNNRWYVDCVYSMEEKKQEWCATNTTEEGQILATGTCVDMTSKCTSGELKMERLQSMPLKR